MRNRIQRAVMVGLLVAAAVSAGACLPPPGVACGEGWCPEEYRCMPVSHFCVKSECGNAIVETSEECDDGNTNNSDGCHNDCTVSVYIKASNTSAYDEFGYSVALSADGSTLAVGINDNQADGSNRDAGAVYVFTRSGPTWSQQAYVKASPTDAGDGFGRSVALSADGATLAVGADLEDSAATGIGGNQADDSTKEAGAVYVFTRSGTTWSQQAYVKASNTNAGDRFGSSVALSADGATLAVGAAGEDSAATGIDGNQATDSAREAGAVYVFTRSGTTWRQQAYVKASNTDAGDYFGRSIALSAGGAFLAVGAYGEASAATGINGDQANDSTRDAGAVYVFTQSGTTWSQQAYVKASNTGAGDRFGRNVALSADGATLAVGADWEDSAATGIDGDHNYNAAGNAGAVYVFTRSDTAWSQQAYVKASNTNAGDHFGWSVALSADGATLAVGAEWEDSAATGIGGYQVDDSAREAGAVYVFTRSGTTWRQQAYVKAPNTDAGDEFGDSVALSADGATLAVGATGEDNSVTGIDGHQANDSSTNAGAVYVYPLLAQ